jgi:hypothetical protein
MSTFVKSRINAVSAIAGVILTLAIMFFCMSLAAALGYWSYQRDEMQELGPKFWTIASEAWALSVFCGSFVATLSARATSMKDGLLNAVTTWAASYLLFGGIALSIVQSNFNALLGAPTVGLFWHGFFGDAFALCGGLAGGVIGVLLERGSLYHKSLQNENSRLEEAPGFF